MEEKSNSSSSGSNSSSKSNSNNNSPINKAHVAAAAKEIKPATSPLDESGISTSSSWTILPPDRVEILEESTGAAAQDAQEQQSSSSCSETANESCKPPLEDDADPQAEDVSDGISIISDCESTGRLSPHPYLRDHLNDLNFSELPPLNPLLGSELRARVQRLDSLERDESQHAAAAATVATRRSVMSNSDVSIVGGYRLPPLLHTGLTAVFYVGVTLALLAFVGRLRNPEWQVLSEGGGGAGVKSLAELEQRVGELELQNNLMRAEIDIMSKQLNYLNALAGQGQGQAQAHSNGGGGGAGGAGRKVKTFKAWPGNGNTVDAVDITKADLKRPYKCPDGKFVEIAAMCMESNQLKMKMKKVEPHAESLVDEIGNVVADVLQQSPAFQQFEKVTERLGTPSPGQQPKATANHAHAGDAGEEGASDGPVPVPPYAKSHKHYDASRERYQQHKKRTDHTSSKERYARKSDRSKEHQKHRRRDTDDSGSGEWHERLMQHREHARQRNEQKRTHNWYIERADSREQRRTGETAGR